MKDVRDIFSNLGSDMLWAVYNLAFLAFGKTGMWPRLGYAIWR